MTNFEKWKSELTVEMFILSCVTSCRKCPARKRCEKLTNKEIDCRDAFIEWASSEYKESGE